MLYTHINYYTSYILYFIDEHNHLYIIYTTHHLITSVKLVVMSYVRSIVIARTAATIFCIIKGSFFS